MAPTSNWGGFPARSRLPEQSRPTLIFVFENQGSTLSLPHRLSLVVCASIM
ncbi:mCG147324 [Mus musculus]|nr:mCG147324 [Mus musculus]